MLLPSFDSVTVNPESTVMVKLLSGSKLPGGIGMTTSLNPNGGMLSVAAVTVTLPDRVSKTTRVTEGPAAPLPRFLTLTIRFPAASRRQKPLGPGTGVPSLPTRGSGVRSGLGGGPQRELGPSP